MKPNKKRITKWVNALESGRWNQGRYYLGDSKTNEYCCLGVACEVGIENGIKIKCNIEPSLMISYNKETEIPPEEICEWLGIDSMKLQSYGKRNDRGASFKDIAKQIRRDYLS